MWDRDKGQGCSPDISISSAATPRAAFLLNDNQIESLCLKSFEWLLPGAPSRVPAARTPIEAATTLLSISGTKTTGGMIIDLWPKDSSSHDALPGANHRFDAVGISAPWFTFNFGDPKNHYVLNADALQFDNVHSSAALSQSCNMREDSPPPPTEQINLWLSRNSNLSLQPFLAFIKAFDNVGADETDFKIAKAEIEFDRTNKQAFSVLAQSWRAKGILQFAWEDIIYIPVNGLRMIGTQVLASISDYGYRPAKVIWAVLGTVILFWLLFWIWLRIVAFTPDGSTAIRTIGVTFLFDRLIPVYKIREDNYDITVFYKRGSGPNQKTIRRFRYPLSIVPANAQEQHRAEFYLDVLKVIGIVLAGFLVAAINALVAK
jgi:hypothetical protein